MRIMIGVDDSPHSLAAVEFVKNQVWQKGTEVVVVSVARPAVMIYTEVYVPATEEFVRAVEDRVRHHEDLVTRSAQSLREAGLAVQTLVVQGDPREVLVDTVRRERIDLLVVGSHGRTGLNKLLMGSVASHVIGHAPCNVLVVRLDAPRR